MVTITRNNDIDSPDWGMHHSLDLGSPNRMYDELERVQYMYLYPEFQEYTIKYLGPDDRPWTKQDYFHEHWMQYRARESRIMHDNMEENSKELYGVYPWIGDGHIEGSVSKRWHDHYRKPGKAKYCYEGVTRLLCAHTLWV